LNKAVFAGECPPWEEEDRVAYFPGEAAFKRMLKRRRVGLSD
jgi:hypothetical protein